MMNETKNCPAPNQKPGDDMIHFAHAKRALKNAGWTQAKIAHELGISRQAVEQALRKEQNFRVRAFVETIVGPVAWPKTSVANHPLVQICHAHGLNITDVAAEIGVTPQALKLAQVRRDQAQSILDQFNQILQAEKQSDADRKATNAKEST